MYPTEVGINKENCEDGFKVMHVKTIILITDPNNDEL